MAADFGDPWVLVETFGSVRNRVREQGQLQPVVMWEQWKRDPNTLLSSKAISLDSSAHCQTQGRRSGPQQSSGVGSFKIHSTPSPQLSALCVGSG